MKELVTRLSRHLGALTIGQQIGLAAAALCLFCVAMTAIAASSLGARQMSELIRNDLATHSQLLAGQLSNVLSMRYHEVGVISRLEPLRPHWHGKPDTLRQTLEEMQTGYSEYSWIGFADPQGKVIAATRNMLEGASVAAHPWFRDGLRGATVGDVHDAKLLEQLLGPQASGEPFRFVDVAFPVYDAQGQTIGVLGAHLSWTFASSLRQRLLQAFHFPGNLELLILSQDGSALLGATVGARPFADERLAKVKAERSGTFVDDSTGERMLVGFATVEARGEYPGLGWMVVARQPYAVALSPVYGMVATIALVGLAAAALGVVLALAMAGRIVGPLRGLAAEADRLGRSPQATMLSRHGGSREVVHLSVSLRALLRRIGLAEQRIREAELRASAGAEQYAHDIKLLRTMAETDPLTGLMNRRAFVTTAEDAFDYFRRYSRPIAVLMVDIDHFKAVNDTHGHPAGDAVIKRIGELIADTLRGTDKVARVGGEEFVMLLRKVDAEQARLLGARICERVAAEQIGHGSLQIDVTVSIGVTLADVADRDVQDTIERADRALYMAKNTGRNRVFLLYPRGEVEWKRTA